MRPLVLRRRCRNEDRLARNDFVFLELERPIVQRRRQPETVVHQIFLARPVAFVHRADLWNRHVRLVDKHQRVVRQVVEQRRWRFAGLAPGKMPRVIFDSLAETELVKHLQIETRALLDTQRFDKAPVPVELGGTLFKLLLDRFDRAQHSRSRRHVMRRWEYRKTLKPCVQVSRQRIEQLQSVDFVVEQGDTNRVFGVLGREYVDDVAAHPERPAMEVDFVTLVLHFGKALDDVALPHAVAGTHGQNHFLVFLAVADTVDARDGGHDHAIAPFQQAFGRRQTHLLDMLVDCRVLFDEQIAGRHVGFWLIVVVVGNEILDGILGQEFAKLGIKLCRQRLVRRQHQCRTAAARNDVGHGEGLAGAGDTQQGLVRQTVIQAFKQSRDGFRLVASRLEWQTQAERRSVKFLEYSVFRLVWGGFGLLGRFHHARILRRFCPTVRISGWISESISELISFPARNPSFPSLLQPLPLQRDFS